MLADCLPTVPTIAELTRRELLALAQRFVGVPTEATSKAFGIKPAAVRMRRMRALAKLRDDHRSRIVGAIAAKRLRHHPIQLSLLNQV